MKKDFEKKESQQELNSFLYGLYTLSKQYGHLVESVSGIQELFDVFYRDLANGDYESCKDLLSQLEVHLGENNGAIVYARTSLYFETD